jgi:hypothetical protein
MSLPTMKLTVPKLYDPTGIQVQELADAALLTAIAYVRTSPRSGRVDL